ncbi:hypothetical protein CAPTEDRAFT_192792 [Capitella teleta]|uniref:Uncharacterized protein n=1 Tax=Capitella teleta TaxID=283909 RepID=R7T7C6_CAPTE|nr:hypothetical protein CAPTEDRAFT_192792 [Capitella teleta]|eukprot:ELT89549.1 hypothetical protein CAPTEDRAFT_192792 [Capitella teleta]
MDRCRGGPYVNFVLQDSEDSDLSSGSLSRQECLDVVEDGFKDKQEPLTRKKSLTDKLVSLVQKYPSGGTGNTKASCTLTASEGSSSSKPKPSGGAGKKGSSSLLSVGSLVMSRSRVIGACSGTEDKVPKPEYKLKLVAMLVGEERDKIPQPSTETKGRPAYSWAENDTDYCYKQLLPSVVNPLGAPDTRPGFRPMDLAEFTRQLFQVEKRDHQIRIREVQQNRPSNIVLSAIVVEAKGIKPIGCTGLSDPYCLLSVQKAKSPMVSPKASPRSSPHSSPSVTRKTSGARLSTDIETPIKSTRTVKSTLYPKWNEEFELDVSSLHTEELYLSIWDDNFKVDDEMQNLTKENKHGGLRGFFKPRRNHVDGKISGGLIGHCKLPVRSVPASGCDNWFELFMDKKRKIKGFGQIRLKLQLSVKQDVDVLDGVESDQCSIEDYHKIVQKVFSYHALSTSLDIGEDSQQSTPTIELSKEGLPIIKQLPEQSQTVLNQFAVQNHFSKVTQKLMELVVLLEMSVNNNRLCQISDRFVKDAINSLEAEWTQVKSVDFNFNEDSKVRILTETEISLFEKAVSRFIQDVVTELQSKSSLLIPVMFPPCEIDLEGLTNNIQMAVSLVNVHLHITQGDEHCQKELSDIFIKKLQNDVRVWLDDQLSQIQSSAKDPVISKTKLFVQVLQDAMHLTTPIFSVSQYFSRMGFDYFKLLSSTMEKRLSCEAKQLMHQIDSYQIKYHRYAVNIRDSSTASLQLYMSLKGFFQTIRANLSDRYVVQVTSLVKYSNSSVDILSCFAKITTEWRQIDFSDADIASLGVTKITDTICDGVKWYVEKVMVILENNGYYDCDDNQQFDVTDQLCITMNNIDHIKDYLTKLPALLDWDIVTNNFAIKHESDAVGCQALRTLHNLVDGAREDAMSVDPLLDYLESNLRVLFDKLEGNIFRCFLEEIWRSEIGIFSDTLLKGQSPEYYSTMLSNLTSLRAYFNRGGVDPVATDCDQYCALTELLKLNTLSSMDLMLSYYKSLTSATGTPSSCFGHITTKVGFRKTSTDELDNTVSIHVKVTQATHLPGMTRKDLSDPFVVVRLCPLSLYSQIHSQRTGVQPATTNPCFNQSFVFDRIPNSLCSAKGAMVSLTVWHHDPILPNDFLGEVLLPLTDLPEISNVQDIEDMPAVMMSLKRPPEPSDGPFQVLKERGNNNDLSAKMLVEHREINTGHQTFFQFSAPVRFFMTKVIGKKSDVVGRYNGPTGIAESL